LTEQKKAYGNMHRWWISIFVWNKEIRFRRG